MILYILVVFLYSDTKVEAYTILYGFMQLASRKRS